MTDKERNFTVSATVTISIHCHVKAQTKAAAKRKALDLPLPSLCHQCGSNSGVEEWSLSGELDGELQNVEVESP